MSQIKREIEEVANEYLFQAYHPIGTNHIAERHMEISRRGLQKRLAKIEFDRFGDGQSMSRFFQNATLKDVCEMICDCLNANEKELRIFLKGGTGKSRIDLYHNFSAPIGEGLVKGLDEDILYKMSRICIVVGHSNTDGRTFEIFSAYPVFDMDELDEIDSLLEELYG